mgnify:CR=1 FL=1
MVLDAWNSKIKETDALLDKLSDEQLNNEVAPGRNRGVYLLGHLVAVHDRMLTLLGLDERSYAQLDKAYLTDADKPGTELTPAKELRQYWKNVNSVLASHFSKMQPEDWFGKHNSVSAEDFAKEPHRNKLNVLISRTNHLSYHLGQLAFLKK